jgi:glycosyltransferase involved in cell wall biosynthesis
MKAKDRSAEAKIAVVIPCYKVREQVINVIDSIPSYVSFIIVVDDRCPENSGDYVISMRPSPRINVIKNAENIGVGGSVMEGYRKALEVGAEIVVKIDGDGQMDPQLIGLLVKPILDDKADYTKGNRFLMWIKLGLCHFTDSLVTQDYLFSQRFPQVIGASSTQITALRLLNPPPYRICPCIKLKSDTFLNRICCFV